jgi:hypothetical protein
VKQNYPINPRLKKKRKILFSFLGLLVLVGGIMAGAWQIKVVRQFFGQASGLPANLIVDTTAILGPMPRPWRNLAQGGEDHAWRIDNLVGQIAAIKPEYIRLDHIYDFYDIVQGGPGNVSFNWTKFDLILDDIIKTGAKPYLALSYMPPAISSGDILAYPVNWADWQLVVQKTIEHVSGTKGIRDVYYEVWNEPDLFGSFKYYGDKNYLTLYAYSSAGAKNARGVLPFKLGGPAITALYENWFNAWAKGCSENNWRCDFFSWHRYTNDLNQYAEDMQLAKTWVQKYPKLEPTLEFQITEWGHDSNNNAGYDSKYGAAHTVAAAISMSNRVERAFAFEIQDGKDPEGKNYWGRWGLFTHNDFGANSKPRYQALKMLDSIADQRLQITGLGSWVKALAAKNTNNETEMVIANFDPKGSHSETVPVTFINIEPGSYTLNKEFLGGSKQNQEVATDAATLRVEILMPANEVAKVRLIKN